ncbi:hypothetical protein HK096_000805 [Nowakowskiella sp. JEL0078]|nr:hypothetical protein HK096_000805 [Nowakowskiella sp. JEL0078]
MSAEYTPVAEQKILANEAGVAKQQPKQSFFKSKRIYIILAGSLVVIAAVCITLAVVLSKNNTNSSTTASSSSITKNLQGCVAEGKYDSNINYFPEQLDLYVPNPNFQVKYFNNYKVITNSLDPKNIEIIVLYQCGTPKPNLTDVKATRVIPVPIKSIFVGDTTSVSFLELLGVRSSIKGTDSLTYITSPCLIAANSSGFGPLNTDEYTDAVGTLKAENSVDLTISYLDSVAINATNYVTFPATADLSAYNRVSWVGFLGAFYNLESSANTIIKTIADNYNCIKAKNVKTTPTPVVAWVEHLDAQAYTLNNTVYVLNRWPVYVQYTLDSGASNVTLPLAQVEANANQTLAAAIGTPYRSYFTNRTAFMEILKTVDVLIDETYYLLTPTVDNILTTYGWNDADTQTYKFLRNKAIWRDDKRITVGGGTDWYETAVVSANLVLNDLVVLAHNVSNVDTTYFRNIWKNGTDIVKITGDQCGATGKDALTVQGLGKDFGTNPKVISCSI